MSSINNAMLSSSANIAQMQAQQAINQNASNSSSSPSCGFLYGSHYYDEKMEDFYTCGISGRLMTDPVQVLCDAGKSHLFEREILINWIFTQAGNQQLGKLNFRCPIDYGKITASIDSFDDVKGITEKWCSDHVIETIDPTNLASYILSPSTITDSIRRGLGANLRYVRIAKQTHKVAAQIVKIANEKNATLPNMGQFAADNKITGSSEMAIIAEIAEKIVNIKTDKKYEEEESSSSSNSSSSSSSSARSKNEIEVDPYSLWKVIPGMQLISAKIGPYPTTAYISNNTNPDDLVSLVRPNIPPGMKAIWAFDSDGKRPIVVFIKGNGPSVAQRQWVDYDEEPPKEYTSSSSFSLMDDPVYVNCGYGHKFERKELEQWMANHHQTCPIDRRKFDKVSDLLSKDNIKAWRARHYIKKIDAALLASYVLFPSTMGDDIRRDLSANLRYVLVAKNANEVAAQIVKIANEKNIALPDMKKFASDHKLTENAAKALTEISTCIEGIMSSKKDGVSSSSSSTSSLSSFQSQSSTQMNTFSGFQTPPGMQLLPAMNENGQLVRAYISDQINADDLVGLNRPNTPSGMMSVLAFDERGNSILVFTNRKVHPPLPQSQVQEQAHQAQQQAQQAQQQAHQAQQQAQQAQQQPAPPRGWKDTAIDIAAKVKDGIMMASTAYRILRILY